jgi:PKD repeat protein
VRLTVKDDGGKTDYYTDDIDVSEAPNQAPSASFTYEPTTPEVDETVTFTDISDDTDGDIVNWTWQFGDGTISYEQNPQHAYNTSDTFTVRLTVTDDDGATDNSTLTIDVEEKEEEANWILPIVAIIILVIIAIVVVYIWRQRSEQS